MFIRNISTGLDDEEMERSTLYIFISSWVQSGRAGRSREVEEEVGKHNKKKMILVKRSIAAHIWDIRLLPASLPAFLPGCPSNQSDMMTDCLPRYKRREIFCTISICTLPCRWYASSRLASARLSLWSFIRLIKHLNWCFLSSNVILSSVVKWPKQNRNRGKSGETTI